MSGYAQSVVGGEGGQEVWVTTTDPGKDNPGTLEYAVNTVTGPRIVKFKVGGKFPCYHYSTIDDHRLHITDGRITIAGETAPEPATLYNPTGGSMGVGAMLCVGAYKSSGQTPNPTLSEIIVRHLRFRYGDGVSDTSGGVLLAEGYNIAFMHNSFCWHDDNYVGLWLWSGWPPSYNVTWQYNLFGEHFDQHTTSMAIHGWGEPEQAGATDYKNIYNWNVHHNLFVHAGHRTPLSVTAGLAFYNNIIYNPDYRMWQTQQADVSDFRNNYIKAGPDWTNLEGQILHQLYEPVAGDPASLYIDGNIYEGFTPADEWDLLEYGTNTGTPVPLENRRYTPLSVPNSGEVAVDQDMIDDILAHAGAVRPWRDALDWLYIREFQNGTGRSTMPAGQAIVGGYPYG